MKIISIVGIAAGLFLWFYVIRYNLHMFQLNTYRCNEEIAWLKKNWKRQAVLYFSVVLIGLSLFVPKIPGLIIGLLSLLVSVFEIYYFHFLKIWLKKKPLSWTSRTKRLITVLIVLNAAILIVVFLTAKVEYVWLAFSVLIALSPFQVMVGNWINAPVEKGIKKYYINDARKMLRDHPDLKVIGITGSYGKTSVKYYLNELLRDFFNVLMTPGNYNTPMGVVITVRGKLKPFHQIFICEMGARHVGDIREICNIVKPEWGVITSIGPQHLDTFGSIDNVIKTKFELADELPRSGKIFLNCDNEFIRKKADGYSNTIPFGMSLDKEMNGYKANGISISREGMKFHVVAPDGMEEDFFTKLLGMHNITDLLAAIAIAHELGISLEDLKQPVRRIRAVEHRMQMKRNGNVTIIDDAYNSNPIGAKEAVETLGVLEGVRILITPGMVELGNEQYNKNYEFGQTASKYCDYIVTVGRYNSQAIRNGVLDAGFPESHLQSFGRLEEAMQYAYTVKGAARKNILLENDLPDNY